MANASKTVKVFGRLKNNQETIVFTCSATTNTGVFKPASDECVRLAKMFLAAQPKSGCGCSKPTFKMSTCECCGTDSATVCEGITVLIS